MFSRSPETASSAPSKKFLRREACACALLMLLVLALLSCDKGEQSSQVRPPDASQQNQSAQESSERRVLRVCADPNNLPFSNQKLEGFENKIAALLAHEMKTTVEYTWWAQRRGFIRNTLKAGICDVVIGVPSSFELALTTAPYYRSTYAFVYRKDRGLNVHSFDDPILRNLRVGVQMIGDDFANTPPAHALTSRHIIENVKGYSLYGDYAQANPPARIIEAVAKGEIDVAVAWGPLAGYFAKRQKVPLEVVPVSPQIDLPYLPFVYDISIGVRRGDNAFRDQLEEILTRKSLDIEGILDEYGVPRIETLQRPTGLRGGASLSKKKKEAVEATNRDDARAGEIADEHERAALEKTWRDRPGLWGHLASVNHKTVGSRFITTAFCFFIVGGILAVLMRIQLARPENNFLGPDLYNQIFTMHGTTMMFLFAVPVMEAMAVYLVPLMVGTRNIAFPRLNAFGYWVYLFGGIMIYVAFVLNIGPDAGWFSYVPLSGPEYSPGKRVDFWAQLITFTEVSALVVATELITTIFKLRAPGMSLNRIPLYVWSVVVMAFMVFFAMPTVALASSCLIMDRLIGTHFFNQAEGGDPILWQHLFWFFGHPEVYIIFIPATGFVSAIIPTFMRRPMFGYTALVLSLISTGFIGFGLWVHHMFAAGLPRMGESFFTAATMMIVIPSGIQIFCWIATIWGGRPIFKTPMLFVMGFFFVFVLGGMTGVMQASVPLDLQVHDTYFIVAHFHYVLIGGAVFPLFGAFYYWFPKFKGRMLSETLGKINFWLMFVGFNLTFFPMHLLGLKGMPRRVYTYQPGLGWADMNLVASAGGVLLTLGVLVFIINFFKSRRTGALAGDNPWGVSTLEWATSSPPPSYNFLRIPTVAGRDTLWVQPPDQPVVVGLRSDVRHVLVTKMLDAEPDHIEEFPEPTIWPLLAALATTALFIGSIFTPWAIVWGAIPVTITLIGWFWPTKKQAEERPPEEVKEKTGRQAALRLKEQER